VIGTLYKDDGAAVGCTDTHYVRSYDYGAAGFWVADKVGFKTWALDGRPVTRAEAAAAVGVPEEALARWAATI